MNFDNIHINFGRYGKLNVAKVLSSVQSEYDRVCSKLQEAEKQLKEYSKDKEIQSLKREIEKIRKNSLQNLSDLEVENIKKFKNSHYLNCKNGVYHYILSGTEIGTKIEIKCPVCGEIEDVSDYDRW